MFKFEQRNKKENKAETKGTKGKEESPIQKKAKKAALSFLEVLSGFLTPIFDVFIKMSLFSWLAKPEKATIGVYSDLPVQSTVDPRTFQPTSAWVFMQQLEELFEVQMIKDLEKDELSDLDLLLIVHPKNLSESALFSVDQYVLSGGKLLAFVDPLAELDQPGPGTPGVPSKSSDLNAITK